MNLHGNARSCPKSRRLLVERIETREYSLSQAAVAAGVSERTAYRWLARWRAEGTSAERTAALPGWLTHYNYTRPHGSLNHKPPGTRLHQLNNLPRNYS